VLAELSALAAFATALLIYVRPPPWVKGLLVKLDRLPQTITPQFVGEALRHAYPPEETWEYANGVLHDNVPHLAEALGKEAVGAIGAIYGSKAGSEMGKKSGAARGYLGLSGIGKQAVQMGGRDLLGGGLAELLEHPIAQQFIMQALQGAGQNNGPGASQMPFLGGAQKQQGQSYPPVVMPHA